MNKEELRGKYIKYNKSITPDVFDALALTIRNKGFNLLGGETLNNAEWFQEQGFVNFYTNDMAMISGKGRGRRVPISKILP